VSAHTTAAHHKSALVQLLFCKLETLDASGHAEDSVQMTSASKTELALRLSVFIEVVRVEPRCW